MAFRCLRHPTRDSPHRDYPDSAHAKARRPVWHRVGGGCLAGLRSPVRRRTLRRVMPLLHPKVLWPERLPAGQPSPYGVNVGRGDVEKTSIPRTLEESYDAAVSAAVPVVAAGLCAFSVVLAVEDALTLESPTGSSRVATAAGVAVLLGRARPGRPPPPACPRAGVTRSPAPRSSRPPPSTRSRSWCSPRRRASRPCWSSPRPQPAPR